MWRDDVSRETMNQFTQEISKHLANWDLNLSDDSLTQMWDHWELVKRWNSRTNLTSISDDVESARLHYADSLAVLPYLDEGSVLDIGSGAGYPGIPIAIAQPDREVVLLEPRRKRVSFLQTSIARLGLKNVRVIHGRSEDTPLIAAVNIVSRATFSDSKDILAACSWAKEGGQFIAFRLGAAKPAEHATMISYSLNNDDRFLAQIRV